MNINENTTKSFYIEIFNNELKMGSATGFEIQHGHKFLITNWHVVSGRNFITKECLDSMGSLPTKLVVTYKKYLPNDKFEWAKETINLYDNEGNKLWYEHPSLGNDVDVVAIPLEKYSSCQHYKECYQLNTNYNMLVTEQLFVVGFPLGYTVKSIDEPHAIWTSGTIASDPDLDLIIKEKQIPAFLIDSKTRQGQSGSPVIYYSQTGMDNHYRGGIAMSGSPITKEMGIYSGRINRDSDLGYVWKWSVLTDIINSINI